MEKEIIVIGGGAAGLMAAAWAAQSGAKVQLLEKGPRLGRKIRISGKGRCNITNSGDTQDFISSFPGNGKFLYSALNKFTNWDVLDLMTQLGVATKIERGGRVFPVSDDADQVADALTKFAISAGVHVQTDTQVTGIDAKENRVLAVETTSGRIPAMVVIVTTGGASYPATGSTGDGYLFARKLGHKIVPPLPALVPLRIQEDWVKELAGLNLRNVELTIDNGKTQEKAFGEMLFAHFGITGPIVLTLSGTVAQWRSQGASVINAYIDLKPALTVEMLDQRIQRDLQKYSRKQFKNGLGDLLPKSLIPVIISLSGINPDKFINQVSKTERHKLMQLIKSLPLTVVGTLPLAAAIVTAGGVDVNEINPRTMESKLVKGLYFAGEVLDIHGVTGGFNLQAAFSTGYLAGISAAKE